MKYLVCHPASLDSLRRLADARGTTVYGMYAGMGIAVAANEYAPRWRKHWQFPDDPFVEYEPRDEEWCRYFGFGCDVDTDEPYFAIMDFSAPRRTET